MFPGAPESSKEVPQRPPSGKGLRAKKYESESYSTTVRTALILSLKLSIQIFKISLKTPAVGNQKRKEVWYFLWVLRCTLKTR